MFRLFRSLLCRLGLHRWRLAPSCAWNVPDRRVCTGCGARQQFRPDAPECKSGRWAHY